MNPFDLNSHRDRFYQDSWHGPCYRFCRDSREAFGVRFYEEKPNRDWMWIVPSFVVTVFLIVLMVSQS